MNERYKLTGLIRAEKFGGLYYERDRLVIELLNNSSFEIMDLIGKGYSVKETIERITKKYDVDYSRVEEDVLKYVSYLEKVDILYRKVQATIVMQVCICKRAKNTLWYGKTLY